MNRRSAMLISAGLVLALVAGTASRVLTLNAAPASASPARIVIQTSAVPQAPAPVVERE